MMLLALVWEVSGFLPPPTATFHPLFGVLGFLHTFKPDWFPMPTPMVISPTLTWSWLVCLHSRTSLPKWSTAVVAPLHPLVITSLWSFGITNNLPPLWVRLLTCCASTAFISAISDMFPSLATSLGPPMLWLMIVLVCGISLTHNCLLILISPTLSPNLGSLFTFGPRCFPH